MRLYYDDPALLTFDATVVSCEPVDSGFLVTLDRSAFYPTSGGQPHDVGALWLGERRLDVRDVLEQDGDVRHVVSEPLDTGVQVRGEVDPDRRRDLRQQHSGQHILSASFDAVCGVRTESVHLGLEECTLDLHREVTVDECRAAEDHANVMVTDDRRVEIRYADASELVDEPRLRKQTGRSGCVRLIDVEGHDLSACGGTHVHRTGEVGAIVIRGTERFRGGTRVTFLCGRRAIASHRAQRDALDAVARVLSVGVRDVPAAVERLADQGRTQQRRADDLASRLSAVQADALASDIPASGVLVAHLPDADPQALRAAASRLVAAPGRLVVLLGGPSPHALVVARSADRTDDAGALVRRICAEFGGKGGGRPDLAQAGNVTATSDRIRAGLSVA